jgi:hypothetical protein
MRRREFSLGVSDKRSPHRHLAVEAVADAGLQT